MRAVLLLGLTIGCAGDDPDKETTTPTGDTGTPTDTDTDVDTDSDVDTDTDTDSDTDSDTDVDTDPDAHLRVLHVAPGVPGQDLLGNGNPGTPAMVDLAWLEAFPSGPTGWVVRPPNTYAFELIDNGAGSPWLTFDATLSAGQWHTILIHGERSADAVAPDPDVLLFTDDRGVPVGQVRLRWTHVANAAGTAPVALRDALTGATYATLAYGETVVTDLDPDPMNVYVDLDGDGACGPGEAFQDFQRSAGEVFHVVLVNNLVDELILLGHDEAGGTPRRDGAPCP